MRTWIKYSLVILLIYGNQITAQIADKSVVAVFSPVTENDSLIVVAGQALDMIAFSPAIYHGFLPLNTEGLGIKSYDSNELIIYPNPFNESIILYGIRSSEPLISILIFNSLGRIVYSLNITQANGDNYEFDLSTLETGIYFFVGEYESGDKFTKKIIKM